MQRVSSDALAAIRAWVRLDRAMTGFNRHLWDAYRVTGAQLAMLIEGLDWRRALPLAETAKPTAI